MQFAKISFGNDRGHSAFRFFTEYNFLLSNWTSCLPSTGLSLSCWEFVMTSNYLLSVKCNFSRASDWSCSVSQCLPLFQCCTVCLCERKEGLSAARCSWALWQAREDLLINLPFSLQVLASEQRSGLYLCLEQGKREFIYMILKHLIQTVL